MSSSMAAMGYVLKSPQSVEELRIRLDSVERHLFSIYRCPVDRHWIGDERSGLVYWSTTERDVHWEFFARRGDEAVMWIDVPGVAGGPENEVDAFKLGRQVLAGEIAAEDLGCPFAVLSWREGSLSIANDVYGLARIFRFSLAGGDVWTTRAGMAHIFMTETARKNEVAWSSMAALGWALRGETQLGRGRQVPPGTRLRAWHAAEGRVESKDLNDFGEWFYNARSRELPGAHTMAAEMGRYIDAARRWPVRATADLSGGKDSRAIAAVGLASGSISQLRTIDTDPEEARVARELVSRVHAPLEHRVEGKQPAPRQVEVMSSNLVSQHCAWEGRYLAPAGFNAGAFNGFRLAKAARFNGLGGEVSNGGNLLGSWARRLTGQEIDAGLDRMSSMGGSSGGTSRLAREHVQQLLAEWGEVARDLGLSTAHQVLDLIYAWDQMPNWSVPYTTPHTLTPYYSAPLIALGVQRIGSPVPDGTSQKELIAASMPQWLDIPFYKGVRRSSKIPFIWELENWHAIQDLIRARAGESSSFDSCGISEALSRVSDGLAGKRDELLMQRVLWEVTFEEYVDDLNAQIDDTRRALAAFEETF